MSIQLGDTNVTSLKQYRIPMKNPILVELLVHWEKLRDGRIAPMRSEIDPRQIENALQYAFILERMSDGEIRFRIAGMQLCNLMGMEVRAMPATSAIAPKDRSEFTKILNRLFDRPEIVELTLASEGINHATLKADMLLLPMNNEAGETSRILGCLVSEHPALSPPYRFKIVEQKVTRIIATKNSVIPIMEDGFAESPDVFRPRQHTAPATLGNTNRRGYLRLVKTD